MSAHRRRRTTWIERDPNWIPRCPPFIEKIRFHASLQCGPRRAGRGSAEGSSMKLGMRFGNGVVALALCGAAAIACGSSGGGGSPAPAAPSSSTDDGGTSPSLGDDGGNV